MSDGNRWNVQLHPSLLIVPCFQFLSLLRWNVRLRVYFQLYLASVFFVLYITDIHLPVYFVTRLIAIHVLLTSFCYVAHVLKLACD